MSFNGFFPSEIYENVCYIKPKKFRDGRKKLMKVDKSVDGIRGIIFKKR
jgi:hypothetical protein